MQPVSRETTYYASGTNSPAYMNAYLQEGHPIGVSLQDCKGTCLEWIWDHSRDPRLRLFVDSGAFHEFTKSKPISDTEWRKRLKIMARIGKEVGDRALIVLPDKVADPDESFNRMVLYAPLVKEIIESGARVMVPIQLGRRAMEYMAGVASVLDTTPERFVLGMPMKASPLTPKQVGKIAHDLAPYQIHLLGLGPESRRFAPTVQAIRSQSPGTAISSDSVFTRRVAGKERGQLTRRRYQALFDIGFQDPQGQMPELMMMGQNPEIWIQAVTNPRSSAATRRRVAEKKLAGVLPMQKREARRVAKDYLDGKPTVLSGDWQEYGSDYASMLIGIVEAAAISESKRGGIGTGAVSLRSAQSSRLGTRRTLSGQVGGMDQDLDDQLAKGEVILPNKGPWNMARLDVVVGREITKRVPGVNMYGAGQAMRRLLYDPKWHLQVGTWGEWIEDSKGRYVRDSKPISVTRLVGFVLSTAKRHGDAVNDPEWLPTEMGLL